MFAAVGKIVSRKIEDELHAAVREDTFTLVGDLRCAAVPQ
jgi:hypothetical protein